MTAPRTDVERAHRAELLIADLADELDQVSLADPAWQGKTNLANQAVVACHILRAHGIHPGQRDPDGLPVLPPHDDNCAVCHDEAVTR